MARPIEEPAPRRPAYFWWLLANALALCFAVVSWAACLHVFGNPEIPRNHAILEKLGRLPELKRYTTLNVPNGSALGPQELYRKFFGQEGEVLERLNRLLARNYLTNFERPLMLTYIRGDYQVEEVRVLSEDDFLYPGFAIRARAMVKPDDFTAPAPWPLMIEYVFPTPDMAASKHFGAGDILEVSKNPNCAALVHVGKMREGDDLLLCLTVIPIAYGMYEIGDIAKFAIEPPDSLNPAAGFPIFGDPAGGS